MAYSGRKKSGKYNAGTKMIVPGFGILMVKKQNGDKIQIKPNNNIIFLPSSTPSSTPPPTPSVTPTNTPTPSVTPTNTPTPSITPTQTPTPSITPTLTPTPTITPTLTPTPTTPPSPFISVWNTSNTTPGSSGSNQVTLPLSSFASTGTIDWGDGNISACTFANRTHTYSSTGIYTITIVSDTCSFNPFNSGGDKFKIIEKSGNTYFYKPTGEKEEKLKLGVGYDSTRTFLKENKKTSEQIQKEIKKKFAEEDKRLNKII